MMKKPLLFLLTTIAIGTLFSGCQTSTPTACILILGQSSLTIPRGTSQSTTVKGGVGCNYPGNATLSVDALASFPFVVIFSPTTIPIIESGTGSTMTISSKSDAKSDTYTLVIRANTNGNVSATSNLIVRVP